MISGVKRVLAVSLLCLAGCSGGDGGQYAGPWAQVSGKVNLGGSPCTEPATITFIHADGHAVSADLKDGQFKLKYNGGNNIPVGKYTVGISPLIPTENPNAPPESFFNPDGSTKVVEIPVTRILTKYHQPGSSGIQIDIAEGKNDQQIIDLDLK
jgi:hypothetical protein